MPSVVWSKQFLLKSFKEENRFASLHFKKFRCFLGKWFAKTLFMEKKVSKSLQVIRSVLYAEWIRPFIEKKSDLEKSGKYPQNVKNCKNVIVSDSTFCGLTQMKIYRFK